MRLDVPAQCHTEVMAAISRHSGPPSPSFCPQQSARHLDKMLLVLPPLNSNLHSATLNLESNSGAGGFVCLLVWWICGVCRTMLLMAEAKPSG